MKFRHFCTDQFKKDCTKIKPSADIHKGTLSLFTIMYIAVISKSVFRYRKVPFYPTNIDNVSFYGKFIHIDIDAQY